MIQNFVTAVLIVRENNYCEIYFFTASSMLDDVCEEEDVLEHLIYVIRWDHSLEIRMHH